MRYPWVATHRVTQPRHFVSVCSIGTMLPLRQTPLQPGLYAAVTMTLQLLSIPAAMCPGRSWRRPRRARARRTATRRTLRRRRRCALCLIARSCPSKNQAPLGRPKHEPKPPPGWSDMPSTRQVPSHLPCEHEHKPLRSFFSLPRYMRRRTERVYPSWAQTGPASATCSSGMHDIQKNRCEASQN